MYPYSTFLLLVILAVLPAPDSAKAQSNAAVDLGAFQGLWHEVARSPNLFQRKCVATTAEYRLQSDGRISVVNRCSTRRGRSKTIQGTARPTDGCNNKLAISFAVPFGDVAERRGQPNYLIHYLSPNNLTAVVGTPKGRLVWILSRSPGLQTGELQQLKCIAGNAGYRTDNLLYSQHQR